MKKSPGENSKKFSGDDAPKLQISVPCRGRTRPEELTPTIPLRKRVTDTNRKSSLGDGCAQPQQGRDLLAHAEGTSGTEHSHRHPERLCMRGNHTWLTKTQQDFEGDKALETIGLPQTTWITRGCPPKTVRKKAPTAVRAMRGNAFETVPFPPYFGCSQEASSKKCRVSASKQRDLHEHNHNRILANVLWAPLILGRSLDEGQRGGLPSGELLGRSGCLGRAVAWILLDIPTGQEHVPPKP